MGSEILDLDITQGEVNTLMRGHFKGETWGLAVHPIDRSFVTSGDEGYIYLWDGARNSMKAQMKLDVKCRALSFSPDGSQIAAGLEHGRVMILDSNLQTVVADRDIARDWIQVIKYSPNGDMLAVGSHDRLIYLLDTRSYSRKAVLRGHSSYITHIDFSLDSNYLQSNCGAYELLFWTSNGNRVTSASSMRDVNWATWTCTLGWPVQGIWPPCSDGTDINAVDRSPNKSLLITGDDFGKVKLFQNPCCRTNGGFKEFNGHSSHVTNVGFSNDDSWALSVGGGDRTVIQWRVRRVGTR